MITEANTLNAMQVMQSNDFRQLPVEEQERQVSQQFEAVLFRQLLGKALKPIFKSELVRDSNADDTYRSFLVDALSQSIASTSPLEIHKLLHSTPSKLP
jgi:Rod binding domain-containing protein